MNLSNIRLELEKIANAEKEATYDDYLRLAQAWEAIKAQTTESYHAVIEDRLRALYKDTLLPNVPESGSVS